MSEEKIKDEEKVEKIKQNIDKQLKDKQKEKQKEKVAQIETEQQKVKESIANIDSAIIKERADCTEKQAKIKMQQKNDYDAFSCPNNSTSVFLGRSTGISVTSTKTTSK